MNFTTVHFSTFPNSATREVVIADGQPTVLIGERINPTGKKRISEALAAGNLEIVSKEALAQVEAGADILDVNVGATSVDEVALLPQAVQVVMATVDVPLCLDGPNPKALEAALKVYRGKPLIDSVTGEEYSMGKVLPLVKEYGTVVIGLVQDEEGIPGNAERRLAIAHKIVERARAELEIGRLRGQMANRSLSAVEAELLRQELKTLRDRNLQESTFEERADLVAKLGIKILPSEDLKLRKIFYRLNLAEANEEREQAGFAKVTFGGAGGIRTPYLLTASQTLSRLSYSPTHSDII